MGAESFCLLLTHDAGTEQLRKAHNNPNVLQLCTAPGVLEMFQNANKTLDAVQKSLEEYLVRLLALRRLLARFLFSRSLCLFPHDEQETKRAAFPRFYFLSNDELLAILSQTREPRSVQPHLRKCFDAIAELNFEGAENILAMKSAEDEVVPFSTVLRVQGNVEDWLTDVEAMMRLTLYNLLAEAVQTYQEMVRETWMFKYPAQVILAVDQIYWTQQVSEALHMIEVCVWVCKCVEQIGASTDTRQTSTDQAKHEGPDRVQGLLLVPDQQDGRPCARPAQQAGPFHPRRFDCARCARPRCGGATD